MLRTLKQILLPVALLVVIGFVIFVINQLAGIHILISSYNQTMALVVTTALGLFLFGLLTWPVLLYMKLPKPLILPESDDELEAHKLRLLKRLKSNRILKKSNLVPKQLDDLDQSLKHLNRETDKIIKETASAVFLSTAISQNGKLDALTILAAQSRMVWKIAHVYYQRPTLREIAYLYANVAASSFLATEIEDLNISQQVEPVMQSFLKNSAGKSIPIIGPTANILLDSLLEGSTNAFLALRVGHIAKRYCGNAEVTSKKKLKRQAFLDAAAQLKMIVMQSSGEIMSGLLKATKKAGVDTLVSGWEGIKRTGTRVADTIVQGGKRMNPFSITTSEISAPKSGDMRE